ncbi:MAG: (deoxy)nucleoside triphosphate pyrophosphohydrolase, partial [Gammaproteobacteria bacterium]|nr:(deoxy)nucleoside triphosphate pyrophosphohydrolase [Gammaproteobacteria bacterium]
MSLRLGSQIQAVSRRVAGLIVVAGALLDQDGRVLIAERPPGKHMAGRWEFPGGKVAIDESPEQALQRELREELGVEVAQADFVMELVHSYPDREVQLRFYVVDSFVGEPKSLDGQRLRWVT